MTRNGHRKLAIAKRRADSKRMWKARRQSRIDVWAPYMTAFAAIGTPAQRAETEASFVADMSKLDWRNYRP